MYVHRMLALVLAIGCGATDKSKAPEDAAASDDSVMAPPGMTRVTGALYGAPFVLQHASVKRGTASDPRIWLCIADIALPYEQCEQSGGPARTMLLGPYLPESNGSAQWVFPQVWLYRVGQAPVSKYASAGEIDVALDDPPTGRLELTLNLDFGETTVTTGTAAIGQ